ncbi:MULTISPECIES: MFS transporter [Thermoleptolyngbya]|nr:MFS transporter [Thermoleptolyngbya sichuanensis]
MKVFSMLCPSDRRNLGSLFVAGLLFWASLASLLPILPLYVQSSGATGQMVGLVMGCFAIGLLGSRPQLARLADDRGRKITLLLGMAVVAIAPLIYIFAESMVQLAAVRAFHGLSIAAFALAYSALVVDLSPPQHRGELIGYMSLVNPIGMGLGPAMGGFLQAAWGYQATFLASAALGLLGLALLLPIREPRIEKHPPTQRHRRENFWLQLAHPAVRTPALVLLLVGLSFGALTTFVPLLVAESGVTFNVGLLYTAAAIASFTIRLPVGRASDSYGRGPFISFSLVLYTLSMVVLWQASSTLQFLLGGFLEGAGAGILIPMMAALMADRALPNERGRMFSLCMVGFDVGIAMAGPVLGAVSDQVGFRTIFGWSAVLTAIALLIFLTLSSKDAPHSLRFALGRGDDIYAVDSPR